MGHAVAALCSALLCAVLVVLLDQVIFSYNPVHTIQYLSPLAKPAPQLRTLFFGQTRRTLCRCPFTKSACQGQKLGLLFLHLLTYSLASLRCFPFHCWPLLHFSETLHLALHSRGSINIALRLSTFALFVPSICILHVAQFRFALSLTLPGAIWSTPESVFWSVSYAV
jgi:hypothetical protein